MLNTTMSPSSDDKVNVLYVDDLQTNLVLFRATFEKDYNIILAESAEKALAVLKDREIQVLVTDQRMPDMTGTELLGIVAAEYPEVRRFLLTAYTDFDTVVEAVNKGHIHGYINKPLKVDEVRLSIDNAVEMYRLRKRNKQMMGELESANRELMNLDGLKSEIIKLISQEIRTPLNRIMGTLHMLKDKVEGEGLSEVINLLDNSVSKLEEFSSMTEQISILRSPGHKLNISEVSLKQVIEYSLIETSGETREKGVKLDLEKGKEGLTVPGESYLLVSCLVNLIRNAVDHCSSGDTISIRTEEANGFVTMEVIDQGKEYSDQLLKDLADHFSSKDTKLNLNLGIELGLAQMIMEAHRGRIHFARTKENKGSVTMVFPGVTEELP